MQRFQSKNKGTDHVVFTVLKACGGFWLAAVVFLVGCSPRFQSNTSPMATEEMLQRATHVFVGVIEGQDFGWPYSFYETVPWLSAPVPDWLKYSVHWLVGGRKWVVLRRRVRVEMVLKGSEARKFIDVYEIVWMGATTGDWNFTQNNERDLFLARVEGGRYHVVRDWWRSIFPIYSGYHARLPLDDSRSLWERIALMNWWIQPGWSPRLVDDVHSDPGHTLSIWRLVKILRGLLQYPDLRLRQRACIALLVWGWGQDECWDALSASERNHLSQDNPAFYVPSPESITARRQQFETRGMQNWEESMSDRDELRLLTTVNNPILRHRFCELYQRQFPGDLDNGCPADQPKIARFFCIE
jgi:hypothetical protein